MTNTTIQAPGRNPWGAMDISNQPAWRADQILANDTHYALALEAVGKYVTIHFGEKATQLAFVHNVTKAGNVKVTAYNASRDKWYPNKRTIEPRDLLPGTPLANPPFGVPPVGKA